MSKKKPKFFCDFCGNEVSQKDIFCNKCGKFFAAVRCPVCGTTGTSEKFMNGCPKCGYAFNKDPKGASGSEHGSNSVFFPKKERNTSGDSLPLWVYILTAVALIIIIFVFILHYI